MSTTDYLSFMKTSVGVFNSKPVMYKSMFTERAKEADAAATGQMPTIENLDKIQKMGSQMSQYVPART